MGTWRGLRFLCYDSSDGEGKGDGDGDGDGDGGVDGDDDAAATVAAADHDDKTVYGRLYFVPDNNIYSKTNTCKLFCSLVRPSFVRRDFFVDAKFFGRRQHFGKTNLGRRDRFGQKIVGIGAILAIF